MKRGFSYQGKKREKRKMEERKEMKRKRRVQGMVCILFCLALLAGGKEREASKEPEETGKEEELYTQGEEYLSYLYVKGEEGVVIYEYLGEEKTLVIPDKIQGMPVVEIKGVSNGYVEKVVVPDSVKSI